MEGKEIIINIKLTGDGVVDIKKLKKALSDFTKEQQKNIAVRQKSAGVVKGSEKALRQEIKLLKEGRAGLANTSKQYQVYTKQIVAVEKQLRELTDARRDDVQVNADMISNQGLASNSLTEFGRLISDAPFGIIAVTNNISQLGSQLGTLSRKTGSAKASFDILIKQLKSGGALILGFQILISLITLYADEITDFIKGTNTAAAKLKQLRKEIEETNKTFDAEEARLKILNDIINDNTASRDSQRVAAEELANVLPNLTEQEILNKDAILDNTLAIEEYIKQQKARAEIDAILDANADIYAKKAKIRAIEAMDEGEEKEAALKEFVKANDSFLLRIEAGMRSSIASGGLGRLPGVAKARGFFSAVIGSNAEERKQILNEISKDVDSTASEITTILTNLQKQITQPAGAAGGEGGGGDDIIIEGTTKAIQKQISELTKLRNETATTREEFDEFTLQIEKLKDELDALQGVQDRPQVEGVNAFLTAEDTKLKKFLETDLAKRETAEKTNELLAEFDQERLVAQEKLADMIVKQAGKFAQIQSQAFDAQIKRLDTERDIILNNDNLTAEEKDRLLKENDKQSRKIRIQQIKFERDMHMIEMSMELAKFALQGKTLLAGIAGDAVKNTSDATGSIGKFLSQLGPIAGPIAYAAMIGGVIAQIVTARKKAEQQIKALSGPLAGVSSSGGGASSAVSAPSFNVVGATQTSQLAQTIAGAEDKPLRAYVVASDVSTAQELERSAIEGASIG
jgi:uncharacterized protein YukE